MCDMVMTADTTQLTTSTLPGNLIEMRILRPFLGPKDSETLQLGPYVIASLPDDSDAY